MSAGVGRDTRTHRDSALADEGDQELQLLLMASLGASPVPSEPWDEDKHLQISACPRVQNCSQAVQEVRMLWVPLGLMKLHSLSEMSHCQDLGADALDILRQRP